MTVDQRYCLNCGSRGAEARLPFLDILRSDRDTDTEVVPYGRPLPPGVAVGAPRMAPPLALAAPTAQERLQANTGLIAGVGVLLLAMLIGVLIGSGLGNDGVQAAAAPPAQIISVGGGAPVAAPTGPTGTTGPDAIPAADNGAASGASKGKGKAKKSKAKKNKAKPRAASAAKGPVKATNDAVKNLDKLTGKAAQKASDKLGKTIPTGGKAPKKDSKPAAAGGSFQDIG